MSDYVARAGLRVHGALAAFIEDRVLPGLDLDAQALWQGMADVLAAFVPENRALLARRDELQQKIDQWHQSDEGRAQDPAAYKAFLAEIGYLVEEPAPFEIDPGPVDDEIARIAGPQLVVPGLNGRFLLNAANARWGSLYDALYGTDAIPPGPGPSSGYDPVRGAKVIAWAKAFLDQAAPLTSGSHADVTGWRVTDGVLHPALADPRLFAGYRGDPASPSAILFRHNGLGIELVIDREHAIGKDDKAGIANILLEAAISTIVDLEDSVAAVDAADKVAGYANWLGVIKGDLAATFDKDGRRITRTLAADRGYTAPDGTGFSLPGRSLLLVRNVGHLMTSAAVLLPDGAEAPEGILDGIVTSLIAMHDLKGNGAFRNSRAGSIYIVKPKMHGPDEAAFSNRLFDAVEDLLGLPRHTIKIGLMDEERRTSANLAACIAAVRNRLFFINTGFLDRTGDEIRTSIHAGPMLRKDDMKRSAWITAYEERNVRIGLASGLSGRAQIGKGMWAAPDRMADMLAQKSAHPQSGASTAWVPSPTAATLHATHYHLVDVFHIQAQKRGAPTPAIDALLTIPRATGRNWSEQEIREELENNAQGILGYVVRWIDQGIGCSKVPDINDIGLMEDRATLRISSQHMANWLLHDVCSRAEVEAVFSRMAAKVDGQNKADPLYAPMAPNPAASLAFQAASALVFEGIRQPNGYTEPLLHHFRQQRKALNA